MFGNPQYKMPETRFIKFVGKTPRRRDNIFGTQLVWLPDEVLKVTDQFADQFIKYPDIWAEVDEAGGLLVDQYLAACAKAKLDPVLCEDLGAVAAVPFDELVEKVGEEFPVADVTIEDVMAAIFTLDRNNEGHFTTTGKPRVKAVSEALGRDVTADDVAEAWKQIDG